LATKTTKKTGARQRERTRHHDADLAALLFDDADHVAARRLAALLRTDGRGPVAFVGSGTSSALGYPTWNTLLDALHDKAFQPAGSEVGVMLAKLKKEEDFTWRAQVCREAMSREADYFRFLGKMFAPRRREGNQVLDQLVRLNFSHYLTTNYDDEIERAHARAHKTAITAVDWTNPNRAAEFVSSWGEPDQTPQCVHLHGRYDRPESIVLTESDYRRAYLQDRGNVQRLSAVLLLHPVVFVGFSLSDPDFMAILRQVNALGVRAYRHFALVGLPNSSTKQERLLQRSRLRTKYGVSAVFFRRGTRYKGLEQLLRRISRRRTHKSLALTREKLHQGTVWSPNPVFPDDLLKERFGGRPDRDGWQLSATISRRRNEPDWFNVRLRVAPSPGRSQKLSGRVDFFVHNTFPRYRYWANVNTKANEASFTIWTYGAFTVGALIHDTGTLLELDLAEVEGAPLDFQFQ
jgi:hypothetical protein